MTHRAVKGPGIMVFFTEERQMISDNSSNDFRNKVNNTVCITVLIVVP